MRARLYRYCTWGDRRHWEVSIFRVNVSRWCSGSPPCGDRPSGHHWVKVRMWDRSWSAADR